MGIFLTSFFFTILVVNQSVMRMSWEKSTLGYWV